MCHLFLSPFYVLFKENACLSLSLIFPLIAYLWTYSSLLYYYLRSNCRLKYDSKYILVVENDFKWQEYAFFSLINKSLLNITGPNKKSFQTYFVSSKYDIFYEVHFEPPFHLCTIKLNLWLFDHYLIISKL